MKTIMLTGGSGFIGSHMLIKLAYEYPDHQIVNIDSQTYAARRPLYLERPSNVLPTEVVNIQDQMAVDRVMRKYFPETLVHMAAESHVCRSISGPRDFIHTNVVGTFNLLEEFREIGGGRFVHVSTDEVFGTVLKGRTREDSPHRPRNPYAASKAAGDMIVRAYGITYGMDVVTVHMANNFGPNQHREKLIPKTIDSILRRKPVQIYGTGLAMRDWLFVEDGVRGIYAALKDGQSGESYCLPGQASYHNLHMVNLVHKTINELLPGSTYPLDLEYMPNARPTDDMRYAMNGKRALEDLGWTPEYGPSFAEKIRHTVRWYLHARLLGGRRSTVGT